MSNAKTLFSEIPEREIFTMRHNWPYPVAYLKLDARRARIVVPTNTALYGEWTLVDSGEPVEVVDPATIPPRPGIVDWSATLSKEPWPELT